MTEDEVVIKCQQTAISVNKQSLNKKTEITGVHELYPLTTEMAEHISYHAVKGVYPEKLFKERSPNETEKEAKYIRSNYKQHTLPVFIDYLNTITRPFGDGNWSIDYREDEATFKTADQTFQKYVEQELPIYGSLENFIKYVLPSIKSIDANGYLAVRPKDIEYKDNGQGQMVVDSEKLFEPTIYYFESKHVIDYCDYYYMFLSNEKSIVQFGGRDQKTGTVFELYTKGAVYFIRQVGNKNENTFETVEFYRHDLNEFPVKQLMGVPVLKGDEILWQSPFLYSTDLLDLVAMNANWLQASINKCVFPIPVMFGSPCTFKDADSGAMCNAGILHLDGVPERPCTQCHGTGLVSRLSALGTFLLNPSTKFETGEIQSTQDPLKFVSPDVATLQFLSEKIEKDTGKARAILHLRDKTKSVQTTKDNTTATEVYDDSKAMYSFVKPISDQIFTIYEFCLDMIGKQRYGQAFQKPSVYAPKTFDFKSPEDYLKDISNAIANHLPPAFIQTILMQYINSFYGDNPNTTSIFRIVVSADRLFGLSQDEINLKLARATVSKWEDILHTSILNFINEALEADAKFFEKNLDEQIKVLQDMAKEIDQSIKDDVANSIYATTIPKPASATV